MAGPELRIGVDFDNTIVCYDDVFHHIALAEELIPTGLPRDKNAVRNHLRAIGREDRWTAMHGLVYGERMAEAQPFPGARNHQRKVSSARSLPPASEACFNLAEHLSIVDRRIERLGKIVPESSLHEGAIKFVRERLAPAWTALRENTERVMPAKNRTLAQNERCISPSDFGFHNTIRSPDSRLRFFDFEYAGWDDPAKTLCDFFCQPAVPVPNEWLSMVLGPIRGAFGGDDLAERIRMLLPVYRTKWCYIMLHDFLPSGNQRRAFSNPRLQDESRWGRQLEKL